MLNKRGSCVTGRVRNGGVFFRRHQGDLHLKGTLKIGYEPTCATVLEFIRNRTAMHALIESVNAANIRYRISDYERHVQKMLVPKFPSD